MLQNLPQPTTSPQKVAELILEQQKKLEERGKQDLPPKFSYPLMFKKLAENPQLWNDVWEILHKKGRKIKGKL